MFARSLGISPTAMARVIRTVNQHSGGLRPGQPKNSVIGSLEYLERLLELAAEETESGAGSGRYPPLMSRRPTPLDVAEAAHQKRIQELADAVLKIMQTRGRSYYDSERTLRSWLSDKRPRADHWRSDLPLSGLYVEPRIFNE